jgi:hypothetical protein
VGDVFLSIMNVFKFADFGGDIWFVSESVVIRTPIYCPQTVESFVKSNSLEDITCTTQ